MYQVGEPVKLVTMSEEELDEQRSVAFREGAVQALDEVKAILDSLHDQSVSFGCGAEVGIFLAGRRDAVNTVDRTVDVLLCGYEDDEDECCDDDCPCHADADDPDDVLGYVDDCTCEECDEACGDVQPESDEEDPDEEDPDLAPFMF